MPKAPRIFGKQNRERKPWQSSGTDRRDGFRGANRQRAKHRILQRDEYECQHCGKLIEAKDSHLDHIVPLSRGGTHDDENLQSLCLKCSKKKTQTESRGQ